MFILVVQLSLDMAVAVAVEQTSKKIGVEQEILLVVEAAVVLVPLIQWVINLEVEKVLRLVNLD